MLSAILNDNLGKAKLSKEALNSQNDAFEISDCHTLHMDISLFFHVADKRLRNFYIYLLIVVAHLVYVFYAIRAYIVHGIHYNNDDQSREEDDCSANKVSFA